MAKFFAVEAKGFSMIFSESQLNVMKPKCKNFNSLNNLSQTSDYSPQKNKISEVVLFVAECSTPMLIHNYIWNLSYYHTTLLHSPILIFSLSYEDLKNPSPPPRWY